VLHVKPYPYYVSDATIADVLASLHRLSAAPGRAGDHGQHLCQAIRTGTLTLATHPFWCAPLPFHDMPDELRQEFGTATLTICKGDLNYRRLLDDRSWPPTTSFATLAAHFPSPVATLRTLKSDVIAGLDQHTVDSLDATSSAWRTDGIRAVVQVRL
jgi:damage control phosphatase ARMT1-like protein